MTASLAAAELPFLDSLDAETIVAIRADAAAFADWRSELRSTARLIERTPAEGDAFVKEAHEVISDSLMPRAREIERAVSKSNVMKSAAAEQGLNLGIGAASLGVPAAIVGAPVAPLAIAGLGLSAVSRWVYSTVFGKSPGGTRGVIATLVRRN